MPWSREIRDPCGYRDDKERSTKECHKAKYQKKLEIFEDVQSQIILLNLLPQNSFYS